MFAELVKLANRAKTINEYDLANAAFAVLLDKYLSLPEDDRGVQDLSEVFYAPPVAWLLWETRDDLGRFPGEAFYDLLVVETASEDSGRWYLHSLNIPVPMLNSYVAITAMKAASRFTERVEHNREHARPDPDEVEALWESFFSIVDLSTIKDAMNKVLDSYECEALSERLTA